MNFYSIITIFVKNKIYKKKLRRKNEKQRLKNLNTVKKAAFPCISGKWLKSFCILLADILLAFYLLSLRIIAETKTRKVKLIKP